MFQENRFSCRETVPYKQFENLEDDQKPEEDVDEVLDATDTSAIVPQNSGQKRIYSNRWDYILGNRYIYTKGQLISKGLLVFSILPKNEQKISAPVD